MNCIPKELYQSPYKGFNSAEESKKENANKLSINPPIRGSIDFGQRRNIMQRSMYQSPYKGFNRTR